MPLRHPHPDSPPPPSTVNGNSANVKSASLGSATHFDWQFTQNRPQLPDLKPDMSSPERSHFLCINQQVVLSVLEYQATFLCAHRARCQRSRSSKVTMVICSRSDLLPSHIQACTVLQRLQHYLSPFSPLHHRSIHLNNTSTSLSNQHSMLLNANWLAHGIAICTRRKIAHWRLMNSNTSYSTCM
jgi:hypothetical protein